MQKKKYLTLILIISLVLTICLCASQRKTVVTSNSNRKLAIKAESPVNINGNYWLEQSASSGHGNSTHPYILENLVIDAIGFGCGISIRNTNAHFILKNCSVMNANHTGIQLENVTNACIMNNTISNIEGLSGTAGSMGIGTDGTDGTEAIGMFLTNCTQIMISSNIIHDISGGVGGNGGTGAEGFENAGRGGDGGGAYGIYLNSSNECLITNNTVSKVFGGSGGHGGEGYISGSVGGTGGVGGMGDMSSGIYFQTSTSITNNWNVIEHITSGAGGNGGPGGDGLSGGGDGGNGNDGGISSGVYFKNSTHITNNWNIIKNVTGGLGGTGGLSGFGFPVGASGSNGAGDFEYGIVLEHSNNSISIFNLIYCQNSIDNGLNNRWDDGFIGNYWAFHSKEDNDPYDGIGDIYYSLLGTANSYDRRPILLLPLEGDFESDGLSNIEEYTLGVDGYRTNATSGKPLPPVLQHILPNPSAPGLIELNWTDVYGVINYYVYRNTSPILSLGTLNPIAKTNESNYSDNITTDGTYYYVVIAENLENSTLSNCVAVVVTVTTSGDIPGFEFLLLPIALIAIIAVHIQRNYKKFRF